MIAKPKLSPAQWKLLSSAFSNMAQAVILFSLASFFVPEAVGLGKNFPRISAFLYFICGLIMLWIGVTIVKKGK